MIDRQLVGSRSPSSAFSGDSNRPRLHRVGNYLKTAVLLAGMTALVLVIGERIGGARGLVFAGFFVAIMNFVTWWFSDRIALAMHGARELDVAQAPWLYEMVERLTQRAGLPMPKLYVIDMPAPNAFATGRSPAKSAVAVTTGLLELMDRRELEGVLAHELSHVNNRDTLISTVAATMAGVITWAVQSLFWFGSAALGRGDDEREEGGGLASLGLLLVAPIAATLLQLAISRSREYGADAGAATLTGDPDALANALLKLQRGAEHLPYDRAPATAHMFIVNPLSGGGVLSLFATHPPIEERVRRLREMRVGRGW
ncbi:MAG TPA: zinc metalloprotease HtpX [Myxococcaceae bacterium]|nr:zinc metalloprotease HtpX [Myxococcaceae bacterium]